MKIWQYPVNCLYWKVQKLQNYHVILKYLIMRKKYIKNMKIHILVIQTLKFIFLNALLTNGNK